MIVTTIPTLPIFGSEGEVTGYVIPSHVVLVRIYDHEKQGKRFFIEAELTSPSNSIFKVRLSPELLNKDDVDAAILEIIRTIHSYKG